MADKARKAHRAIAVRLVSVGSEVCPERGVRWGCRARKGIAASREKGAKKVILGRKECQELLAAEVSRACRVSGD